MKLVKKLLALAVVLTMVVALPACSSSQAPDSAAPGGADTSASTGTSPPAGSTASTGEKIKVIMAHNGAETSTGHMILTGFKEYLESNSDDFICEIYPLGQLGGDREAIESTIEGSIQITNAAGSAFANFVSAVQIFDLPYAVRSYEETDALLGNDTFWTALSEEFAAQNLKLGVVSNSNFRTLSSKKPVEHIEDFKGITVRVMENPVHMGTFEALGSSVAVIAFSELYTALQQGLVDAQDNNFQNTLANRFYEQSPYLTSTYHQISCGCYVANLDWYNSLTDDQQTLVDEAWAYGYGKIPNMKDDEINNVKLMQDTGKIKGYYEFTQEDIQKGSELCAPIWEIVKGRVSPEIWEAFWTALEEVR